jgi:excinuclease UvrABC nuclease subunit
MEGNVTLVAYLPFQTLKQTQHLYTQPVRNECFFTSHLQRVHNSADLIEWNVGSP